MAVRFKQLSKTSTEWTSLNPTLLEGEINGGSVLIPKNAFEKVGLFDEKQRITQERDMWSRLIKYYDFVNIPYDTSYIRLHESQVTNTSSEVVEKTDKKNIEILSNLSEKDILKTESNDEYFYKKIALHYKINDKENMYKDILKLIENKKEK